MDIEVACHDLKEPAVIDEKLLYNSIIQQGPQEEEGRLYKQQGVVYEEVKELRLEFSGLCEIGHYVPECNSDSNALFRDACNKSHKV